MSDFTESLASALDAPDPELAISRAQKVVIDEVLALDPGATARTTGYFNHSYIPDIVVEWKEGRSAPTRNIFLRHSLRSSEASGDFDQLERQDDDYIFLTLEAQESAESVSRARAEIAKHPSARSLVATAPALDEIAAVEPDADPVLGLVRSSLVRSGRGLLTESDADSLSLRREARADPDNYAAFESLVTQAFSEEAAYRIRRVNDIVQVALSDTPDAKRLFEQGELSQAEIRETVPFLLDIDELRDQHEFWFSLAQILPLESLEKNWDALKNVDLFPLAQAGSGVWRSAKASLSLRADSIDDDDADTSPRWAFVGKTLAAEVGPWRVSLAASGSRIRSANRNLGAARWDVIKPHLSSFTLTGVELAGLTTRGDLVSRDMTDVTAKAEMFIDSVDDAFHIPSLTVAVGDEGDRSEISVDFTERLASAKPAALVSDLVRVSLATLAHSHAVGDSDMQSLLGAER